MTTATIMTGSAAKGNAGFAVPVSNPYNNWIDSTGVPVYREYFIDDLRTVKVGGWAQRGCDAAFIELTGQQGVTGCYVLEIGPGQTLPKFNVALDECIYVLQGRGLTTIYHPSGSGSKSFEWDARSCFLIPANHPYELSNAQGAQKARVMVSSYLPLAMSVMPNPDYFFKSPVTEPERVFGQEAAEYFSKAKTFPSAAGALVGVYWVGNFFPDMAAWSNVDAMPYRGAGGRAVMIEFPDSPLSAHMSVFPSRMYKRAHRHGPGFIIVIPKGEGYSIMWPEGGERIVIPWHEGSCFVPPMRWFHQHFNVSEHLDRYLAIHPPRGLAGSGEQIENRSRDQIDHPDEDPWVRQKFEEELAKRRLTSRMPADAYKEHNYQFSTMEEV